MAIKVIELPLYLKPNQLKTFEKQLVAHAELYNSCLAKHINFYKTEGKTINGFSMIKNFIPEKSAEDASLGKGSMKLCNYSSLQQTVRRLSKAFSRFFNSTQGGAKSGYPRFKNVDNFKTIEYSKPSDGWRIKGDFLYVQHLGLIKTVKHLPINNAVRMSMTKKGGKVFAYIMIEQESVDKCPESKDSVGIDFGLNTFVTTSDGEKFAPPAFYQKSLKETAKIYRRINKHPIGSKQRAKHKRSLNTKKRKDANRRKDFNHKLSRKIINRYKTIIVEDIVVEQMLGLIKNINRAYYNVAWGQFTNFLRYKAENAGRVFLKVNPAYTTQECSACGNLVPKLLTNRFHVCSCGHQEDRDINAAKNILRRGLASLEHVEKRSPKSS